MFGDVHEAAARCVRAQRRIEPDPAEAEAYDRLHQRFRALYPALHDDKDERP
jgi:sugar (pentulose or hexulose) kinase